MGKVISSRSALLGSVVILLACSAERPLDRGADAGVSSSAGELRRALYDVAAPEKGARLPIQITAGAEGRLVARRRDSAVFFGDDGFAWSLRAAENRWGVRARIVGARAFAMHGDRQTTARVNQFVGSRSKWITGAPVYERVVWDEIKPGIDMIAEPSVGGIAYRFVVSPGANLADLKLVWEGMTALRAANGGRALEVETGVGTLRVTGLRAFAVTGAQRTELAVRHVVEGDSVTFAVDGWDGLSPLVIDPTVSWSTYVGGTAAETGGKVAVDVAGNVYVTGGTASSDFPKMGASDPTLGGADAFVTKISPAGALIWSTYLGGASSDHAEAIDVDGAGNAFIVGYASSDDFPTTGGFDTTFGGGGNDGFVTKLTSGGALAWSSYVGGNNYEQVNAVAADSAGNVVLGGQTSSTDFATTTGAYDTTKAGIMDAFVMKVSAAGALQWSTFLGGASDQEEVLAITADPTGNVIATGRTQSNDFPQTSGLGGGRSYDDDVFVTKFTGAGALSWSLLLGSSQRDNGTAIATDASGSVYVTGGASPGFPISGGFDTTYADGGDAFVVKLTSAGAAVWSTFLGGSSSEDARGIAVDSLGAVVVTGSTNSSDFPLAGAFDATLAGTDAFVVKLSPTGGLFWASYLGGDGTDEALGVDVDSAGNIVVAGQTNSSDFATSGALDATYGGANDVFVSRLTFLAKGAACTASPQCVTSYCVDGVCCDKACAGSCEACSAAKKGSGADGTCGNVAAGTDPKNACPADSGFPTSCRSDGMCDGMGACRLWAPLGTVCGGVICAAGTVSGFVCNGGGTCADNTTSCAPFACDAMGKACRTTCAADTDCAATAFCGTTSVCIAKRANGESCAKATECTSGQCADGVCCNSACTGQCESCSEAATKGTCTPIKGAPVGGRTACSGTGMCAGSCDGVNGGSCSYPIGTVCAETCAADTETISKCDAMGACTAGAAQGCNGMTCEASTRCKTTCLTSADCASGFTCASGKCAPTQCSEDGKSVLSEGKETSCSPALCKGGKCVESCSSTADCAAGFVCNPSTTKCEAPPAANEDSGGCAVGGRGGSVTGVALLALALLGRRRRARV